MERLTGAWVNMVGFPPREFDCGYCGRRVASDRGYVFQTPTGTQSGLLCICPNCNRPSFFGDGAQIPGVPFGSPVASLPKEVEALYEEARKCAAAGAPTSAVMAARKLLMHIAVDKHAPAGQSFLDYVDYLAGKGFVPPDGKDWVDHIRAKGNEANHEIRMMAKEDAEELISFAEMLLKFIYEFPSRVPRKAKP